MGLRHRPSELDRHGERSSASGRPVGIVSSLLLLLLLLLPLLLSAAVASAAMVGHLQPWWPSASFVPSAPAAMAAMVDRPVGIGSHGGPSAVFFRGRLLKIPCSEL